MAEIDMAQKPRKVDKIEWREYPLQLEDLKNQAQDIKQNTTQNALRVAELAISGKMGDFLKQEKSRIPSAVGKLREEPDKVSVHLAHMAKEKVSDSSGKSFEVDIYSIRFEGPHPETFTIKLGEDYTQVSLAKGKTAKVLEVAEQVRSELTFERYS